MGDSPRPQPAADNSFVSYAWSARAWQRKKHSNVRFFGSVTVARVP
jgi:hypothetical protein